MSKKSYVISTRHEENPEGLIVDKSSVFGLK